jgi:hypothetical protein
MGVQISLHGAELCRFLQVLQRDRNVLISDAGVGFLILHPLGLSGAEQRPFTDEEIASTLKRYQYFKKHFQEKGLWPAYRR